MCDKIIEDLNRELETSKVKSKTFYSEQQNHYSQLLEDISHIEEPQPGLRNTVNGPINPKVKLTDDSFNPGRVSILEKLGEFEKKALKSGPDFLKDYKQTYFKVGLKEKRR